MPSDAFLGNAGPAKKKEELSSALEQIAELEFNYSEEDFRNLVASSTREISEDAILNQFKAFRLHPDFSVLNGIDTIVRILNRESMQDSPKRKLIIDGVKEIAKQNNYNPKYIETLS